MANSHTTTKKYEDSNFVAEDSPVTHDIETDIGCFPVYGYLICDGTGDILVEISTDGTNYGDQHTLKSGEKLDLYCLDSSKIKITHSGTDSAYRILVY